MRVKFLKPWSDYQPDDVAKIPDHLALAIIVEHIAVSVEGKPAAVPETVTKVEANVVAAPETAVMPKPRKRRGRKPKPKPPKPAEAEAAP